MAQDLRYGEPDWDRRPIDVGFPIGITQHHSNKSYEELRYDQMLRSGTIDSSMPAATRVQPTLRNQLTTITVMVGRLPNQARWTIHQELLTSRSRFVQSWKSTHSGSGEMLMLLYEDPALFDFYVKYLYSGLMATTDLVALTELYALGHRLDDQGFKQACYETVTLSYKEFSALQISTVLSQTPPGDVLRTFIVDKVGRGILDGIYTFADPPDARLLDFAMPELMRGVVAAVAKAKGGRFSASSAFQNKSSSSMISAKPTEIRPGQETGRGIQPTGSIKSFFTPAPRAPMFDATPKPSHGRPLGGIDAPASAKESADGLSSSAQPPALQSPNTTIAPVGRGLAMSTSKSAASSPDQSDEIVFTPPSSTASASSEVDHTGAGDKPAESFKPCEFGVHGLPSRENMTSYQSQLRFLEEQCKKRLHLNRAEEQGSPDPAAKANSVISQPASNQVNAAPANSKLSPTSDTVTAPLEELRRCMIQFARNNEERAKAARTREESPGFSKYAMAGPSAFATSSNSGTIDPSKLTATSRLQQKPFPLPLGSSSARPDISADPDFKSGHKSLFGDGSAFTSKDRPSLFRITPGQTEKDRTEAPKPSSFIRSEPVPPSAPHPPKFGFPTPLTVPPFLAMPSSPDSPVPMPMPSANASSSKQIENMVSSLNRARAQNQAQAAKKTMPADVISWEDGTTNKPNADKGKAREI
jgi:hypothetical protein